MVNSPADIYEQIISKVMNTTDICVAVDDHLNYLALNQAACAYLKINQEDLLGKCAIQVYPEIIASRNHRNMLRALSGKAITDDLVESRMGDLLRASYEPVYVDKEVRAVILQAVLFEVNPALQSK